MSGALGILIATERCRQRRLLRRAALCAMLVTAASVLLLGLSGWFITASAIAGAAGVAAAQAFNYMLPSATIRLLAIVRTGARYGERLAGHEAAFAALARIRPALFRALAGGPAERALAIASGDAASRLVQDVDAIEACFVRRSAPWGLIAATVSGGLLVALGGWRAAASTLICMGALLATCRLLSTTLERPGRRVQRATGALKQEVAAMSEAVAELRCYALEEWAADGIDRRSRALAQAQRDQAAVLGWFDLCHAAAVALAATAACLAAHAAGAPVAALAALAAAMTIDGAGPVLRDFATRGATAEAEARLDPILTGAASPSAFVALSRAPVVALHADRWHLLDPGGRAMVTGRSGAGKTSLIEALLGLRPLAPGVARIDGVDAATIPPEQRRRCFAWAPQDAALLSGTVRDNLRLARPDADDAALWGALRDAALDDRVRALPGGLDGWIGENGLRLSGGERRRLSLARAFLSDAPWLLLDEPGAGLDHDLADRVCARLDARIGRTKQGLILIAHGGPFGSLRARDIPIAARGLHPQRAVRRRQTCMS